MITEQTSVVIVESQPMMRSALSSALAAGGMTVLAEVAESHEILQTASQLTPDLILFSVGNSSAKELDRISVLRQELPEVSIVALITGEVGGQYQSVLDHGAHLVLTKSTPRSELLKAIKKMAGQGIYPATMQVN